MLGAPGPPGAIFFQKVTSELKIVFLQQVSKLHQKSIFAPRGPEGGHGTPFPSHTSKESEGAKTQKNTFRVKSLCEVKSNFAQ